MCSRLGSCSRGAAIKPGPTHTAPLAGPAAGAGRAAAGAIFRRARPGMPAWQWWAEELMVSASLLKAP